MLSKSIFLVSLCLVSTVLCYPSSTNPCNAGESYWCQSEETAVECGVQAYCQITHQAKKVTDHKPVIIELYYESFCGGCRDFITNQLFKAFQKLYSTGILQIGLYPYGNAKETKNPDGTYTFNCQHGEQECTMNIVETCAIHVLHDQAAFMPFIHCLESSEPSIPNAKACAESLKVDWNKIASCANSTMGNTLEHEMAIKTDALNPRHDFVPWITMNGKHTWQIQDQATDDLIKLVCDNYVGTKPHACRVHTKIDNGRCYKH